MSGTGCPRGTRRAYQQFRHGPGAFKVDFAVEDGVPWPNPAVGRAGTVHLGGSAAEIVAVEARVPAAACPSGRSCCVGQQYLADPSRSRGNVHPLYAYAHVPAGYDGDATEAIIAQIERFAPGFRDRIVGRGVTSTRRSSPPATPTSSAATSRRGQHPDSCCSVRGPAATRTAPASRASTCARPPRLQDPEHTAWPGSTRPPRPWLTSCTAEPSLERKRGGSSLCSPHRPYAQVVAASRTSAVSTNCSNRTISPPRTTKWWATRTANGLPVALLRAV